MPNPFADVLSQAYQDTYNNVADAMLQPEPSGFAVPCQIVYVGTAYEPCPNCGGSADPIGQKPSNVYLPGAPVPLPNSSACGVCGGSGQLTRVKETTENINLVPVWDYRSWVGIDITVKTPEGGVQTVSAMSTVYKIKRASYLLINTDIQGYKQHKFERDGEPSPVGLGVNRYVFTFWRKI